MKLFERLQGVYETDDPDELRLARALIDDESAFGALQWAYNQGIRDAALHAEKAGEPGLAHDIRKLKEPS
jgi:hypothetical protein